MEARIKKLLIILVTLLFGFRLWQTTGCIHFSGFYLNPLSVRINVEEQRNLDKNSSKFASKIFHNRISAQVYETSKAYFATSNPRFILELLGPLGVILLAISFSKITKNPKSFYTLGLLLIAIASFLLILPISPKKTFYAAAFAWFVFTLPSSTYFSKTKGHIIIFLLLLIASFWYFALSWQMETICNEIFFN